MTNPQPPDTPEAAKERSLGIELFNHVWELLEKADRSADDDAAMIHATHASCHHWLQGGTPMNAARGEWQCSRVYAVLGRPEPAKYHAARVLSICEENGIGDFDIAFAYEALARAHGVAGDAMEARKFADLARTAAGAIADDEDRDLVLADLATLPIS